MSDIVYRSAGCPNATGRPTYRQYGIWIGKRQVSRAGRAIPLSLCYHRVKPYLLYTVWTIKNRNMKYLYANLRTSCRKSYAHLVTVSNWTWTTGCAVPLDISKLSSALRRIMKMVIWLWLRRTRFMTGYKGCPTTPNTLRTIQDMPRRGWYRTGLSAIMHDRHR